MEDSAENQSLQNSCVIDTKFVLTTLKEISEMLRNMKQTRHQAALQALKEISEMLQDTTEIDLVISTLDNLLETLQGKVRKDQSELQQKKFEGNQFDLEKLGNDWPSVLVARSEIGNFTKGLYKPRSFNVFDGTGKGIKRRIRINSKIAYLKSDVIEWLKNRRKR